MHQIKTQKLDLLIGPQNCTYHSRKLTTFRFRKISSRQGFKFCSCISEKTDEFSVKQEVEKFLRRVQLKAFFFHEKEDDSNISNKDTFEILQIRKSKWTPPEGQFTSLDFFIKKCCHDINKLKFNRNTKFSILSSEEWSSIKKSKKNTKT